MAKEKFERTKPHCNIGTIGQASMVLLGKCRYRFNGCQVVMLAVENTGRDIPDNRVLAHIAKILP